MKAWGLSMLEKEIEKKVSIYAKNNGMLVFKFTSPSHRGVCDKMFIHNGNVFFIEFKQKGKLPTKLQSMHHQDLVSHGIAVYVVDGVEVGKKVIDSELGNKRFDGAKVFKT